MGIVAEAELKPPSPYKHPYTRAHTHTHTQVHPYMSNKSNSIPFFFIFNPLAYRENVKESLKKSAWGLIHHIIKNDPTKLFLV